MAKDNAKFIVTVESNIGPISYINTSRKTRPAGLRKPYEYVVPKKNADTKYAALRDFLKSQSREKFQCSYASKKGVSKGFKLNVFLLGYKVGLCGDRSGCTPEEWDALTKQTQNMIFDMLGNDAEMYIDAYSADDKFQARIETYVAYQEML